MILTRSIVVVVRYAPSDTWQGWSAASRRNGFGVDHALDPSDDAPVLSRGGRGLDKTKMGHSGEGRLLVGHGPREGGVAVDSSFVGQLASSVGRFEGSGCDERSGVLELGQARDSVGCRRGGRIARTWDTPRPGFVALRRSSSPVSRLS